MGDLISVLLSPCHDDGAFAGRIKISVPRMGVGETSATTLAMVIHELATNSIKHGALSSPTGALDITSTSVDNDVLIVWAETGGPEIVGTPDRRGFGSRIVLKSVEQQLKGEFNLDWQPVGLVAALRVSRLQLAN